MSKKKPQLKLATPKDKNTITLEAKVRMLESMIYRMANDITLNTAQLLTLAQILEKGDKYEKKN